MILISSITTHNLGDDLFVAHLCDHYRDKQFLMFCPPEYSKAYSNIINLKLVSDVNEIYKFHSEVKLQVLIGGSLFMQPRNEDDIYFKCQKNKKYRYFEDVPFVITGANFGPFNNDKHYILHKEWFSTIEHISFRDRYSQQLFKDLNNVSYAPDLLFGCSLPKPEQKHKIGISCIFDNHRTGLPDYNENKYINFLADICNNYINNKYSVSLFSFCNMQEDNEAAKKILKNINNKDQVDIIEYNGDISFFLNCFLSCEFIVGTRFHSIVLALNAEIPVFPIIYNLKSQNLLNDLKFSGHSIPIEKCDSIDFNYVDYNRKINMFKNSPYKHLSIEAMKHFSFIDPYIM